VHGFTPLIANAVLLTQCGDTALSAEHLSGGCCAELRHVDGGNSSSVLITKSTGNRESGPFAGDILFFLSRGIPLISHLALRPHLNAKKCGWDWGT